MNTRVTPRDTRLLRDYRRCQRADQARIFEMALQGAADGVTADIRGADRRAAVRVVVVDLLHEFVPVAIIRRVLQALAKPHYVRRDGAWVLHAAGVKEAE